jgi:hypothetical protein
MTISNLKFGIMCGDTASFPKWQADAITLLIDNKQIECSLLIQNGLEKPRNFSSRLKLLKYNSFLWQIYSYILGRRSIATKSVSLSKELSEIPKIVCNVRKQGNFSEFFNRNDVEHIKSYKLDFILRFEFGIIKGCVLNSAKYGVWSFHHGDEQEYRGGPPGFWEIYHGSKITGSILQRLNDKLDAGIVLKKCFLQTQLEYVSNRDQMFLESSKWPLQVSLDILNNDKLFLSQDASSTKTNIKVVPTNRQFIFFILKTNIKKIKKLLHMLIYVDYWNIGISFDKPESFLIDNKKPVVKWFPLKSKKMFYADPCGLKSSNGYDIFFEEYQYKQAKGVISYTNYTNGVFTKPKVVLEEGFHLSYPFLVEDKGCVYMIPESYEANRVMLYKATEFPKKWKMVKVLIDNYSGVDNTLIKHNKTWWMFSSDRNNGSSHNLNLFYADDLMSTWTPHPSNPIKTDIRSSRSAGKPFIYNDNIYRPSMDYSEKTEGSITINIITSLTKSEYGENAIKSIFPYKNSNFPDKIHHLYSMGDYTLIDGCKQIFFLKSINMMMHQLTLVLNRVLKKIGLNNE